ncbi:MAG: hypothetical protein ABIJ26_01175 [Candidatus Margulisiibacteriota bacterium]|nr:hypothetical protein [Candidatus Margulisiibacteriota bacterium]
MRNVLIGLFGLFLVFAMGTGAVAGTYLYGFMPGGQLGGGFRFDLKEGVVADVSAVAGSGSSGSTYSLYGDIFWGNWGIGATAKKVAVNSDLAFDLNIQYAVEHAINDDIMVGIGITLINYDTTTGTDPNITLFPAIGPYFVLAL